MGYYSTIYPSHTSYYPCTMHNIRSPARRDKNHTGNRNGKQRWRSHIAVIAVGSVKLKEIRLVLKAEAAQGTQCERLPHPSSNSIAPITTNSSSSCRSHTSNAGQRGKDESHHRLPPLRSLRPLTLLLPRDAARLHTAYCIQQAYKTMGVQHDAHA